MLNGALIGCGFFAINQLNAWRDLEREGRARIVAVCDRDPARLEIARSRFGIEHTYADADEMLAAERLDFVDVATTAPSHRALVERAAANRLPVICQKPLAPTLEDAKSMVATCARAGVPFMAHENFRWQPPIMAVKEAIDSGEIGAPFFGRVSFRSAFDVFAGQPYLAEGERFILEDLGVHILDVSRFLFGDAERLVARTQRVNPRIKGEDVATLLLSHESGVTSVVDCSYATKLEEELFPQTIVEVDGSKGTIRLKPGYELTVTTASGTSTRNVSPAVPGWGERPWHTIQQSVYLIQKHWVECLETGREPATSGRDNLKTYQLVESAYQSAATAMPVDPRTL